MKEVLLNTSAISEDELRRVEAYVLGIPFVNLKDHKIEGKVLSLIPEPIARKHNVVAFQKTESSLEVAMLDTEDLAAIDFIKKKRSSRFFRASLTAGPLKRAPAISKSLKAEFGDIIQRSRGAQNDAGERRGERASEKELKELAEDLPVVKIVNTLLKHAIVQNASDIHIEQLERSAYSLSHRRHSP